MAITDVYPEQYHEQLADKTADFRRAIAPLTDLEPEVHTSQKSHFRQRAEFKIWHGKGRADYAMYRPGEYKQPFTIEQFPVASHAINELMPRVLEAINRDPVLGRKLFQCNYLTSLRGEALVSLIYHKKLDDSWQASARVLADALGVNLVGRSRKQKLVLGRDWVRETFHVDGRDYHYQQVEGSFTQPNGGVCEKMLNWAVEKTRAIGGDLVELYCGNGNFTLPLSRNYGQVVATELAKGAVKSAIYNAEQNGIDNITLVRMSAEEFSQALDKVRPFTRLKHVDLDSYDFSSVFVDPPRAGMDPHTREITQRFEYIIYISCNPDTLIRDLEAMQATHRITELAVFDQFPYTNHLECGVVLRRRD